MKKKTLVVAQMACNNAITVAETKRRLEQLSELVIDQDNRSVARISGKQLGWAWLKPPIHFID
ncbi:hypothetical protein [Bradyrhizobium yuanmingense]|uniref:hypothetical protein n=1 Tax=Bradyrhizobium yuanmingense TaxID=108015 RepID=UPI0023B92348|nr:hypothetical protein [Bradyrhizobium yuanmingense]MDF0581968.1 hypothetical protein [Bradyrhizobium yuanmingense]